MGTYTQDNNNKKTKRTERRQTTANKKEPKQKNKNHTEFKFSSFALASGLDHLRHALLPAGLVNKRSVDVWNDTTSSDGGLNKRVQLLVSTNGQLQMAGCNALDLEIGSGIAGQLQHLSTQVLHDGGGVHGSCGAYALVRGDSCLEVTVHTAHRKLEVTQTQQETDKRRHSGGQTETKSHANAKKLGFR